MLPMRYLCSRLMAEGRGWATLLWCPACVLPILACFLVTSHDLDFVRKGDIPPDFASSPEVVEALWCERISAEGRLGRMGLFSGARCLVGSSNYLARAEQELKERASGRRSLELGAVSLVGWAKSKSPRAYVSYLESLVAAVLGAVVLWTLWAFLVGLWHSRRHRSRVERIPHDSANAIFTFLLAVMAWTFLTVYSNWYWNFCVAGSYTSAIPHALLWLGLAGLVMDQVSPSRAFLKNVGTWIGLLVFGIFFENGDKGFTSLAAWFYEQEAFVQGSMSMAASLSFVILGVPSDDRGGTGKS